MNEQDYKTVGGIEYGSGYAFRIQIASFGRELAEYEKDAIYKAQDILADAFRKGFMDDDPLTHEAAAKTRTRILACFGVRPIFVEEIPNGYCSNGCCAFYPWFIVTAKIGRIKIGWRKSVIHLEWTDSALKKDAKEIFPKEEAWPGYETTQYDKVIHAHSYEKAAEYIDRLYKAAETQ